VTFRVVFVAAGGGREWVWWVDSLL